MMIFSMTFESTSNGKIALFLVKSLAALFKVFNLGSKYPHSHSVYLLRVPFSSGIAVESFEFIHFLHYLVVKQFLEEHL